MRPRDRGGWVVVGLVVSAIVWLALRSVDWNVASSTLALASIPLVLIAGAVTLSSAIVKAVRWWIFLRRSTGLTVGHVIRLTLAGFGLNSVMAANAGDVARVGLASRVARVPVLTILGTLASDKATDVAAFATVCLVLLFIDAPSWGATALPWILAACAAGLLALTIRMRSSGTSSASADPAASGTFRTGVRHLTGLVALTRANLRGRDAAPAYALSLLAWSGQVGTYALGARAIGVDLPIMAAIAAVVAVNLGGVLRATPGNLGVFQAMYVLAVVPCGIAPSVALSAAIVVQLVQLCSSLLAAGVTLVVRDAP
jgi:uncharacterized membrane protein YbhN (UPF0104 family)